MHGVEGEGAPGRSARFAALDLGTNNCRLMVADRHGDRFRVVETFSQIVRLGEDLDATGSLGEAAMARTIEALAACRRRLARHGRATGRYVATQACRAAANGAAFIERARRETGIPLEIIDARQEAKFAMLGAVDLAEEGWDFAAVLDIGGGSTELVFIDAAAARRLGVSGCARRPPILGWVSAPFGVVTLSERWARHGRGDAAAFSGMRAEAAAWFAACDAAQRFGPLFAAGRGLLIGNSGTVTSLAGVHLGLTRYQRSLVDGAALAPGDAVSVRERLAGMSIAERAASPCIGPQRADLVLAGCAILEAAWSIWPSPRLRVGDRGLREGVILSLIHAPRRGPVKRRRARRPALEGRGPHHERT